MTIARMRGKSCTAAWIPAKQMPICHSITNIWIDEAAHLSEKTVRALVTVEDGIIKYYPLRPQ